MKFQNIRKIRRTWDFNPASRPHSTPKGKRGYDRDDRQQERELRELTRR